MTIDVHAHTVPEPFITALRGEVPDAAPTVERDGQEWFLRYPWGRRSGPVPAGMFDTASRLADMDRQGIDVQALSVPPTHFLYQLEAGPGATAAALHNDAMFGMAAEHPDRFRVLATLPLQDTDAALAEVRRVTGREHHVGFELGTNVAGRPLDDPDLEPLWAAIDAAGVAVVLHPNNVAGADRMRAHYLQNFVGNPMDTTLAAGSLLFGGVLSRHRRLRITLLHGGGFLPYQIGRFAHGWRVRPEPRRALDEDPRTLLDRFWFDTLTHDSASLRFLCDRVGTDRLCLGSDYPFDMADPDPVGGVRAALGGEELGPVLEGTATELLTPLAERSLTSP